MKHIIRIQLTIFCLILLVFPPLHARTAQHYYSSNDYNNAIKALNKAGNQDDSDLKLLGQAYMLRGYLLRDMADFQVRVGQAYYFERDTSKTARHSPFTQYFLARYLFEDQNYKDALSLFASKSKDANLSADYRNRAKIWAGACLACLEQTSQAQNIWSSLPANNKELSAELTYAQWRIGQNVNQGFNFPEGSTVSLNRLRLWKESQFGDETLYKNIDGFDVVPDITFKIDERLSLRFYDPATLFILADADFLSAAQAFISIKKEDWKSDARYLAAVCFYESKNFEKAQNLFFELKQKKPDSDIYLGAIDYQKGNSKLAGETWKNSVDFKNTESFLKWFQVVTEIEPMKKELVSYGAKSNIKISNMGQALSFGRCLLRLNLSQKAKEVLAEHYPADRNNQIEYIRPSYLVVLAHAKFNLSRMYFSDILGHLTCLKNYYPVFLPLIDIAQGYMTPDNPFAGSEKRPN